MQESEIAITSILIRRKEKQAAVAEERDTPEPKSNWDEIKKDITTQISIFGRNIVRENFLMITSFGLLYLKFVDAYYTGHSQRIEQCIECFAVIFQSTKSSNYTRKMMYIVAYFKKLWKKEMKNTWLYYCLINIFGRPNKFVLDD